MHYLSSIRRDALHTLARALLVDCRVAPAAAERALRVIWSRSLGGQNSDPVVPSSIGGSRVGGSSKVDKTEGGGDSSSQRSSTAPLLNVTLIHKFFEILAALSSFSGDGRQACIEVSKIPPPSPLLVSYPCPLSL